MFSGLFHLVICIPNNELLETPHAMLTLHSSTPFNFVSLSIEIAVSFYLN